MFTSAYTPEQSAYGKLDNGRDVLILYVKEFRDQVQAINKSSLSNYTYTWYATEFKDAYVLQVTWENEINIAIRFNAQHFVLIEQLLQPKDVILTTTPISELMTKAQTNGHDFLEFDEVLTFSGLSFSASCLENADFHELPDVH